MTYSDIFSVKDKVVLITGATGGLGKVFAESFLKRGSFVILNSRDEEKLESLSSEFSKNNYTKNSGIRFDVTHSFEIDNAITQIEKEYGPIDILVNNAGINIRHSLENYDDNDWDKIISTNLTAVYKVSKRVSQSMINRKRGKIINIGSMQCEISRPTIAPYAASKGGVKMLTKAMAVEWAGYNIQVNGLGPGYFKTNMTKALYENTEFDNWLCNRVPSRRWGSTDELIGALIFLSSQASDYVNGHMLYVDGGLLASV